MCDKKISELSEYEIINMFINTFFNSPRRMEYKQAFVVVFLFL